MAIQFQERLTYFGMPGVVTTKITLVSRDEVKEVMKEGTLADTVLESLGHQLRRGAECVKGLRQLQSKD